MEDLRGAWPNWTLCCPPGFLPLVLPPGRPRVWGPKGREARPPGGSRRNHSPRGGAGGLLLRWAGVGWERGRGASGVLASGAGEAPRPRAVAWVLALGVQQALPRQWGRWVKGPAPPPLPSASICQAPCAMAPQTTRLAQGHGCFDGVCLGHWGCQSWALTPTRGVTGGSSEEEVGSTVQPEGWEGLGHSTDTGLEVEVGGELRDGGRRGRPATGFILGAVGNTCLVRPQWDRL